MVNLGYCDEYPRLRHAELLRESEMVRLGDLAARSRRPVRRVVANWLVAIAEWIEPVPQPRRMPQTQ